MKSGLDIVEDVASLLQIPELTAHLDGKIWQWYKPSNRSQTDVVVNLISGTNQQIQQGAVNINIHAPNIDPVIDGKISPGPDRRRLEFLSGIIHSLVDQQFKSDFFTKLERPAVLFRDDDFTWYANVRVRYFSIQANFKNI